ncbi:cytochrome D1 domain-containing protein [Benzoatithermus flavus]|uniref:Cytochrome D1 domain-containing protein n=1 Tax=Benzoatithermus flavus TaxID=3108223 RepID=A0ABU8XVT2_9PROT
MRPWLRNSLLAASCLMPGMVLADGIDAAALYAQKCASCHGAGRLGGMGPALLPENLGRLKPEEAAKIIAEGRPATQMRGFSGELSAEEVEALASFVMTPLEKVPAWGREEILASRQVLVRPDQLPDRPRFTADPLNLFVVVEAGDHHVTILDGDTFEPLTRFASRFALHGGPKFSPDGRFVTFMSRDGWITRYDLWSLQVVAEARAGINSRNIAISGDGKVLAVANYLPNTLVLLDAATLEPLEVKPVQDPFGKKSSRVSAVYQAAPRQSFVVALKDLPEVWEVAYSDPPPKSFGFVHSYEQGMVEGLDTKERFPVRRSEVAEPLDDFFFDPTYAYVIGASRDGRKAVVVNLDVRRPIKELPLPGMPHLGSGISWERDGRRVLATPHLQEAAISVIDMKSWELVKRIETAGPGFFMRSHENSRYVWTDASLGKAKDTIQVIDKESLEIEASLRPEPGRTAGHVEFTRDGRYALVSIMERDGALLVYDATTLQPVRRIPMNKPVGKYNVWNKISRSEGTSH